MNLDDQFTLLITTYNRYPYLLRLLKYYQSFDFPFNIHILDSSIDKTLPAELKIILTNGKIKYFKFDPKIFIAKKIGFGTQNIKTPYAGLCADDDFIIQSGISACIEFLEKNHDYALAHGKYLAHYSSIMNKKVEWIPIYLDDIERLEDHPLKRLENHLQHYHSTFYAIHRTNILQKAWQTAAEVITDFGLSEILPSAVSILYGKKKIVDIPFSSREMHDFSWYDPSHNLILYSDDKCLSAAKGISQHIRQLTNENEPSSLLLAQNILSFYTQKQKQIHTPTFLKKSKYFIRRAFFYFGWMPLLYYYQNKRMIRQYTKEKIKFYSKFPTIDLEFKVIENAILRHKTNKKLLNYTRKNYISND